jgi:hypothetical protein
MENQHTAVWAVLLSSHICRWMMTHLACNVVLKVGHHSVALERTVSSNSHLLCVALSCAHVSCNLPHCSTLVCCSFHTNASAHINTQQPIPASFQHAAVAATRALVEIWGGPQAHAPSRPGSVPTDHQGSVLAAAAARTAAATQETKRSNALF